MRSNSVGAITLCCGLPIAARQRTGNMFFYRLGADGISRLLRLLPGKTVRFQTSTIVLTVPMLNYKYLFLLSFFILSKNNRLFFLLTDK